MLTQVTQNATKKVYVLYWSNIPWMIFIMIFPFYRYVFIFLLLLLLIIQNAIYYYEINKYFKGVFRLNDGCSEYERAKVKTKEHKLQKITIIIATVVLITAFSFTIVRVQQIKNNHNVNTQKIESCFRDADTETVTLEKNGIFGLPTVSCENNNLK